MDNLETLLLQKKKYLWQQFSEQVKSSPEFLEARTIIQATLSTGAAKLAQGGGALDKGADCSSVFDVRCPNSVG